MASILNLQFQSISFQPTVICVVKHQNQNCIDFRTGLGLFCSSSSYLDRNKNRHKNSSRSRRSFQRFLPKALTMDSQKNDDNKNSDIQSEDTAVKEEEDETNNIINNKDENVNTLNLADKNVKTLNLEYKNVKTLDIKDRVCRIQQAVISLPPVVFVMKRRSAHNLVIGLSILATILVVAVRGYLVNKSKNKRSGTIDDLVRRGQLKYDRRGISASVKYDDPFNNPMVKMGKNNSTVEMCGKVYRMTPVTLTGEQQAIHQKRRSRAYEWKRPTVFLKEGDPIPANVDPETIRWIPANHPFATTVSDIDEDLAQSNVNLKRGVPFRVQAEHEALQKKLEALQSEQKLDKLAIDPSAANDFERPFNPRQRSGKLVEPNASDSHCVSKFSESEDVHISPSGNGAISEKEEFPKI